MLVDGIMLTAASLLYNRPAMHDILEGVDPFEVKYF